MLPQGTRRIHPLHGATQSLLFSRSRHTPLLHLKFASSTTNSSPMKRSSSKLTLPATHPLFMSSLQRHCSALLKDPTAGRALVLKPLVLYVDGSRRQVGAGAAMYTEFADGSVITAKMHLGPPLNYTSTTAEYWGALIALESIAQLLHHGYRGRSFVIATDNLCVFACLTSTVPGHRPNPVAVAVQKRKERIRKQYLLFQLQALYTPGHSDIVGNQRADRAAKAAAGGETSVGMVI
ncbi:ribonuclease H-like domain-containing protein [Irpex rosettiformis]|uniref:Ribonuclease H-like domain-containing protein n=1 Tax=Irpex rosettiformis TaxID=378272 RepID=A0ACB8U935_9APHY|nr:ribonuclease H-like domain-containing protein [Irpex rosettiformis]